MENKITGDVDKFIEHVVERHELLRKYSRRYDHAKEIDLDELKVLYTELLPYRYNSKFINDKKWFQLLVVNSLGIGIDECDTALVSLIYDNILLGSLYVTVEDVTKPPLTYEEIIDNSNRIKKLISQGVLKEVKHESFDIEIYN